MPAFASLFAGGGGADLGAIAAGFTPLWAVEHDAAIAGVYRANLGDHVLVADVCAVDYAALPRVDWLHASPVCTRYSVANAQRGENDLDIATAQATARAIETLAPRCVTIENVPQYAASDALRLITASLDRLGYWWHAEVLNSADYGVPQTRRRLIVRASLDMLRPMPQAQRWVGWYAAIEDLIPTLPPSAFAAWQLARLPEGVAGSVLVGEDSKMTTVDCLAPSQTIVASNRSMNARAFIVSNNATEYSDGIRDAAQPAHTTTAQQVGRYRAFLMEGTGQGQGRAPVVSADQPAFTVRSHPAGVKPRAWLIESKNSNQQRGDGARAQHEPATTVVTDHKPSHQPKAWLSQGRVVQMSPRALARFQAFPDTYALPDKAALACRVIGNACPPLLMQTIGDNWSCPE
jgi:DNA (cytosine-5)-methyltransferase 1